MNNELEQGLDKQQAKTLKAIEVYDKAPVNENRSLMNRGNYVQALTEDTGRGFDIIDRTLQEFNIPQTPNVVNEFGVGDVDARLQMLMGQRQNPISELIGFDNNMPFYIQQKILGNQQTMPNNNVINTNIQTISPEEKIRRMLEW